MSKLLWVIALFSVLMLIGFGASCGGESPSSADNASNADRPVDTSPPVDSLDACGEFREGDNLNVCTATYLDEAGTAEALDVFVAGDSRVVVAKNWTPDAEESDPSGVVVVLSPTGDEIEKTLEFDQPLRAIDVDDSANSMLIALSDHLAQWDLEADSERWSHDIQDVDQVRFDGDLVAASADQRVHLFDGDGQPRTALDIDRTQVNDIAVDGERRRIYITGFHQVDDNLQQPFLFAYDGDGQRQWTNWDWSSQEADNLSSDTRGESVTIGRDGHLYYVGESHGGVTTHLRAPRDLDEDAPLVRRDDYSQSHNWNGAAPLGFVARLDAGTGELDAGQLLAVRLSDGRGNAVSPQAVTANEEGTIFLGGSSACCIERWEHKEVADQSAMPEYGGGQWTMALSPDFEERHLWTTFSGGASNVEFAGLDAGGPTMAVVHTHEADDGDAIDIPMITSQSLQPKPPGGPANVHLTIAPTP